MQNIIVKNSTMQPNYLKKKRPIVLLMSHIVVIMSASLCYEDEELYWLRRLYGYTCHFIVILILDLRSLVSVSFNFYSVLSVLWCSIS